MGDHLKSLENLLEFKPQIIAPGHGEPFLLDMDMVTQFRAKLEKQDAFCQSLMADLDTDVGMDPSPLEIFPYQSLGKPGDRLTFELRLRNHRSIPVTMEIALVLPSGWSCHPSIARMNVNAHAEARTSVEVAIAETLQASHQRVAIAADVLADGKYLGQIAEAVIDVRDRELPIAATTASGF